jgi:hypothetical protein
MQSDTQRCHGATVAMLTNRVGCLRVQEINIKLWRNDGADDWTVELNGRRHEHVCAQEIEDLIEAAVSVAEKSLTDEQRGTLYRSEIIPELSSKWVEVTEPQSAIEHQLDKWIKQVSEANDELATALHRLMRSFELLLAGQRTPEANAILAQAERALKAASMAKNVA